jgi:hypothetical protein
MACGKMASGVAEVALLGFVLMARYFLHEDVKRRKIADMDSIDSFFMLPD